MSVSVNYKLRISTTETLVSGVVAAANPVVLLDQFDLTGTLNSGTSPPATKAAYFSKALTAGAGTIDLTALTGAGGAVDGTGLKVQLFRLSNPIANANGVTISHAASNSYGLWGSTYSVTLQPGESVQWLGNDTAPDVAGGAKNILLTGTGSQAFNVSIVMG